jgi:hypothetical protein
MPAVRGFHGHIRLEWNVDGERFDFSDFHF